MLLPLLQRGFNPPPNPGMNNAAAAGVAGIVGVVVCVGLVFLVLFLVPYVFMLVRAMQALQATSERNRTWAPGLVWLALVPCLNVFWPLLIVTKVTESLNNEFDDRGLESPNNHGKSIGMAFAVLVLINAILGGVSQGLQAAMGNANGPNPNALGPLVFVLMGVGCLNLILVIAQIVLPLVYGIQLGQSINELKRDDDYDDRPRKKRRRPARDEDDEDDRRDDDFEEFDDDDRPRRLR